MPASSYPGPAACDPADFNLEEKLQPVKAGEDDGDDDGDSDSICRDGAEYDLKGYGEEDE